ncbi:MAG: right-handed parallel beta-helix repeat-containing protein [Bradyrhizobium sp.]
MIYGGSGADSLYGGASSDTIYGGPGTRLIVGGGGPTLIYGGAGAGVTINGGNAGDVIIGSDGGGDSITGGAGNDRIELRGGNNHANGGGGANVIIGSIGNDVLVGASGNDSLIGGAASDQLQGPSTDSFFPNSGVTGDSLSAPSVVTPPNTLSLPSDGVAQGWWSPVAGPQGMALGGTSGDASSPAIAADAIGPWVAWTQTNDGIQGLYVAHDVNGTWVGVGGSVTGAGLSLAGAAASDPSIAIINGAPVVTWTSTTASGNMIEAATYSATANGGAGGWVGLGNSYSATGISGVGDFDNARIVETSAGPVITWRNLAGAAPSLYAMQYNGTAWVAFGAGAASGTGIAGSAGVGSNYSLATDGTHVAVAFSATVANGAALQVLQYSGGVWASLASPNPASAASTDNAFSTSPSVAYFSGSLFITWVQQDRSTVYQPRLYAEKESGGVWSPAGTGAASGVGLTGSINVSRQPVLAASGSTLTLVWVATIDTPTGQTENFYSMSWNGSSFAAVQPTDVMGTGIGQIAGIPRTISLSIDPSGRVWLANETVGDTGLVVLAGQTSAAHMFIANGSTTIASLLSSGQVAAGDLILVTATTTDTTLTLGASAAGVRIAGLDGVSLTNGLTIDGATGLTIRNLIVDGAVSVTNTANVTFAEDVFGSPVTLSGATGLLMRNNQLGALTIAGASQGTIHDNILADAATGLTIDAVFTGLIFNNDISAIQTAVVYAAAAALSNNRIHGAAIGVSTNISDPATMLGAVAGSTPNIITGNNLGISLSDAQVIDQQVTANITGLSGSGIIGGSGPADFNLITYNQTGIAAFSGLIEYNRIEDNSVGITATNGLNIFSNQIVANTTDGILISGVSNVEIAGNTIHSYIGDAIHLTASAYNVEIVSNIIWADTGYGIYVDNNSQNGFWSDYNTLYETGTGKIVYWTRDFTDILDWQNDVATFDLHSVGTTVVNPNWAEPHFGLDAYGFEVTRPLLAGQRASDPTIGGGDPDGSFLGFNGIANLIANGNFENSLTGWTVTQGGTTSSSLQTPWQSTAEFYSGTAQNSVAQQTVSLLQQGVTAAQIDAASVQVAFGGQVSILSSAVTAAQISIQFLDGGNNAIGNAIVVSAGSNLHTWMRVFDTLVAPSGARSVEYLFSVAKSDGSSAGALLDGAFLGVIPQGVGVDQGVRTSPDVIPGNATLGRISLRSPDLYVNWDVNTPKFVSWDSFGAAAGQPVTIQLWQDGANGPQFLATIASSTPDTGQIIWTPSQSGITAGTTGLRIRIVSVANPSVYDMSTETFAVPRSGSTYYVATTGSNRNDGKDINAPLPNPDVLFRDYAVGAGSVVNIAAGSYPLIQPLQLSGTTDFGFGLDAGFTVNGAVGGGTVFLAANPDFVPQALIQLTGAAFVSLNNLTLQGGVDALLVNDGSDNFSASYLASTGASGAAFNITTNSSGALDHLSATGAGGAGLSFTGTMGSITYFTATGDHDGIIANGTIGLIAHSALSGNTNYGLELTLTGTSLVEGNTIIGNATGAWLSGTGIIFGDANLADGLGNIVSGNSSEAVFANGAEVVGNTISNNTERFEAVDINNGGTFIDNLVFGNAEGVQINTPSTVTGNRIFDNAGAGLVLDSSGITVTRNTLYSNGFGIQAFGSGHTISNNLIYADTYAGISLENAANVSIVNNTIYEPTAGTVVYSPNPNYNVGAVVLDGSSTGTTLSNNIVVALAGVGLQVANNSQAGFTSDYNLFQTGTGGRVGTWLGLTQTTLSQWRTATGRDTHSQSANPLFVSPAGADGKLGYFSPTMNGNDDDFHVMSQQGSDHGGSLSVIVGANGLPQLTTGAYTGDASSSPAIDGGNPASPVGAQPSPNGGIIEIGAYGGTAEASLSPSAFLTVTSPSAGAALTQGATTSITWNSFNVSGSVNISVSADGGTTFTTLASGVANTGSYSWTINPATYAAGSTYVVEVASAIAPAIFGESSAFSISPPVHVYFVNGSATGGQYTTATGSDSNDGQSAGTAMATLGALLAKYTLGAGDIVYVDAGTYNLTQNIVIPTADSGTGSLASQVITIQGPRQAGLTATFNRQSTASGFYDFEFQGAKNVTLANLTIKGGAIGVSIDDNTNGTGITITNSVITANGINIYDGVGDNNFTVTGSTISNHTANYGIEVNGASGALIANDTIQTSAAGGFQYGVYLTSANNATVSNDTFTGPGYAPTLLYVNTATNLLVNNVSMSGSNYYSISVNNASGIVENSTIDSSLGTTGIGISGPNSGGTMIVEGNTVFGEIAGNSSGSAIYVSNATAEALDNIVYNSDIGITVVSIGIAQGNQVHGSRIGILVDSAGSALGNTVYNNTLGIVDDGSNNFIENNTLYGNATGIQIGQYSLSSNHTVFNNTIVQTSGVALSLLNGSSNYSNFRDNIVSLTNAIGIVGPAAAQVGFSSDYNLFDLEAGSTFATWSGQTVATLVNWKTEVAQDLNSVGAIPGFVDAANNNYVLTAGSPALNRGDPALQFLFEPVGSGTGNGDRIDIGALGGTALANSGPAQLVQLLGTTGGQRYQVGQSATVSYRSAGLTSLDPVIFINTGGGAAQGMESWNAWQANEFATLGGSQTGITAPVNANGYDIPQAVLQDYSILYGNNANSATGNYAVPVTDGTYQVSLIFVDPGSSGVGQRLFNVTANGVNQATNFDVYKAAGGADKATELTFNVTASGGLGIGLNFHGVTGYPIVSGIQISRIKASPTTWTANAQASYDNGVTWNTIATGLTFDSFGAGSFTFTPTAATAAGLLRIVATDGAQTISDTSLGSFVAAPAGNNFYINATGSDSNDGKSQASAMASLAALLNVYKLQPGDTVHVGAGTYTLPSSITLGASDSGAAGNPIQIIGAGPSTIFNAGTTASSTSIFTFNGAHDVTLENMALVGGGTGVTIMPNTGSTDVSLQGLDISGFSNDGLNVGAGAANFSLTGSNIHDPLTAQIYDGIDVDSSVNAVISNDTFSKTRYGVNATGSLSLTISHDTFTANYEGVNINYSGQIVNALSIDSNTITGSANVGIYVSLFVPSFGIASITNNTVTGSQAVGILASGAIAVQSNTVTNDVIGLELSGNATAIGNTVTGNSNEGIEVDGSFETVQGNTISGNNTGLYSQSNQSIISNNLFLNNTTIGIRNVGSLAVLNNTFVQIGGTAIQNSANQALSVENNVFRMTGGTVFTIPANDQSSFSSNYNMFDLLGGASMALWAGLTVPDLDAWMFGTGFDTASLSGDPQFTNPSAANYYLLPTSPGIDAGDPTTPYILEPGNNGGRVNLGFEGNTANATQNVALAVQVISPNGLNKLQIGQPTTITFATNDVTGLAAVSRVNLGGPAIAGTQLETNFITGPAPSGYSTTGTGAAIDVSGVSSGTPAAVYADEIYTTNSPSFVTKATVGDGTYVVTLNFAEYFNVGVGGRVFNIKINGTTVATNFDIYKTAGNQINKAVDASFTVTASGGSGITIELDSLTPNAPAALAGYEIDKQTASAASQTAKVEVSPDNGSTWVLVANAAPIDAHGNGAVAWTPNFITAGNTALVRVTVDGVSALSRQPFLVTNAGNAFYINDNSTVGDEYTTAVGNDLNSGKTPNAPMASLTALLRNYTLGPGDIVYVDTGSYQMLTDAILGPADSGNGLAANQQVTFQGPTAHVATLNRENINGNVFQFAGAQDVTIADLTMTGAGTGVLFDFRVGSNNVTLTNDVLENNQNYGVYVDQGNNGFTLNASQIFGSVNGSRDDGVYLASTSPQASATVINNQIFGQYIGIYDAEVAGLIQGNSIHDNGAYGIEAQNLFGSNTVALNITGNNIFNNGNSSTSNYGLFAQGTINVTSNNIYGQAANNDIGLWLGNGAIAIGNTIYQNYIGMQVNDLTVTATQNRIFVNSNAGVVISGNGGIVEGNRIYSNGTGIIGSLFSSYFLIENNLIYSNSNGAIAISGGGSGPGNAIVGNTIWQSVGTSIALTGSTSNTTIADNIIWGDEGTILSIAASSETGFAALYNLYYRGTNGAANLVSYGGTTYATLSAWQAAQPLLDAGSREGNPDFIDIAGADNVLGGPDTALGGGQDDNFTPGKNSPAIDASDAFLQLATDFLGQSRHDDPATANVGIGQPVYDPTVVTATTIPTGTVLSGSEGYAGNYAAYTLPFKFNFYGLGYSTIYISPTGAIFFSQTAAQNSTLAGTPSLANLQSVPMIAPFWSAINTRFGTDAIYADTSVSGYVTLHYVATPVSGDSQTPPATFAVRLGSDGSILFEYGSNLNGIAAVIGVSAGVAGSYTLASISGQTNLSDSNSIALTPNAVEGLTYYDIGAIEFQGSSSNHSLPEITGTVNLPANGTTTDAVFTAVTLDFNETLDAISATSAANYQLIAAGPDGIFGTADDITISATPAYSATSQTVTLLLINGALPDGSYRLTVNGSAGLLDSSGNALDGAGSGTPGSAFVSTFTINRSADLPPVFANTNATTPDDESLPVTLQAADPEGNPITFAIVNAPLHGQINNFNATTGAFTYIPNYGYVGSDTIKFSATDSKLAQTAATLSINVTPANTPPVASEESANAIAGTPVTITLAGSDLQTPANQLILAITSQPTHGVLTVTGQDTVSYVATKGYQGADSFAYTWTDTGSPAGTSGNALTSAPATVSIAVATINHAPTTGPAAIAASENQSYTFNVSDFPFADPNDLPANTLKTVIFETLPGAGTITDNSVAVVAGQAVLAADIAQGKVVFAPTANSFGSTSFTFAVQDNGGTANGGLDTSGSATATINVAQRADHPPTTSNVTIGAIENTPYVFALKDFPFADPNDTPPNALQAVVIVSLPGAGTLSLNGQPVTVGQVVLASDIAAGKLSFLAAAQATAKPYTTFTFKVQDNGDDSGGGSNISAAATATINVTTADGAVIKNTFKSGVLFSTETDEADGSYDIRTFVGGTFGGVAYASYDNAYTTAKFRDLETFYNTSGNVLASEVFAPNGNDTITIGGIVKQQKTVNPDGSYQIAFTNVTGAAYTSYIVQYGTNGKAESATYSNGISALWAYNPDGTYQIAYSGVTGAAYTSYTVQYGSNGKVESATYSNGLSAAWTYNADGSYQIAYSGVTGAAYTGYTVQYNASGKPTSAAYNNGMNEAWTYNSDGTYQISYTGLTGVGYTSYAVQYGANGKATSAAYGNGQSALWTYNSDGSYQIAYSGVVGAGYTSYTKQYGANGKPTSASYGNGESAVWIYNSNGSYQIVYSGVVGAGYTSYTIQYGVNGKPTSAIYGNGQSAVWTYNSNGSYQIAYSGVVGAGYTSYTIQYDANGKPTSASYSNGESAVWTYNSNGSYQIAYSGVVGAGYTSYTIQYGANGKPTSASYGNGENAVWTYNSDGSYQIAYSGVVGAGYTSYTVQYGVNGRATSASYSNGLSAVWTYNVDGSYQIAYSGVARAAYTSYTVQYGTNGKPTSATYSNGMTETWTYNSDGSFQIVFAGVTGAAYTSYTVQYSANGRATSATYSNGQSATWAYNPDGSYHITYAAVTSAPYTSYTVQYGANGKPTSASFSNGLSAAWAYNADGSYQVAYTGVPGTFDGVAYASYTLSYTSTGFLGLKTYYNTGGSVVATVTYSPSGGPPTIKLSAMTGSDGDDSDIDNQGDGVTADLQLADTAMVGNGSAIYLPTLTAAGWNGMNSNSIEATANINSALQAAAKPRVAHHAAPELLVQALVGGIVLPAFLTAKGDQQARKSKGNRKPFVLSTFDLLADRFEPVTPDADPADLPSAMFADEGAVDWVVMNGN